MEISLLIIFSSQFTENILSHISDKTWDPWMNNVKRLIVRLRMRHSILNKVFSQMILLMISTSILLINIVWADWLADQTIFDNGRLHRQNNFVEQYSIMFRNINISLGGINCHSFPCSQPDCANSLLSFPIFPQTEICQGDPSYSHWSRVYTESGGTWAGWPKVSEREKNLYHSVQWGGVRLSSNFQRFSPR